MPEGLTADNADNAEQEFRRGADFRVWGPNKCAKIRGFGAGCDFRKCGCVSGLWTLGSWLEGGIFNKVISQVRCPSRWSVGWRWEAEVVRRAMVRFASCKEQVVSRFLAKL